MNTKIRLSFQKMIVIIILFSIIVLLAIQAYFINKVNRTANEQILAYMDITADQLEEGLNNLFKNVSYETAYLASISVTQNLLKENDPMEIYKLQRYAYDSFRTTLALDEYIYNAIIVNNSRQMVFSYGTATYDVYDHIIDELFEDISPSDTIKFHFYKGTIQDYLLCTAPVNNKSPQENQGYLIMVLNVSSVASGLSNIENGLADFFFLAPGDQVISTNAPDSIVTQRSGYSTIERRLSQPDYRVICQINNKKVVENYTFFQTNLLLIAAVMVLLLIVIGILFSQLIATPIQQLIREVTEVGVNTKKKTIAGNYSLQLTPLVHNINEMLENISDLSHQIFDNQQKLYLQEIMRRESDLYALRNQINPHFLFNTLLSMSGMALLHGERKLAEICTGMADMFAYALRDGNTVTVENEMDVLKKYLSIMQFRLGDKFIWKIDIPMEMQKFNILKMLLQPLVENAIAHGIEKRPELSGGEILIRAMQEDDYLIFQVKDNENISETVIRWLNHLFHDENILYDENKAHKQIGLANIAYRVRLVYGTDCGIRLSKEAKMTLFELKIKKEIPVIDNLYPA